MSHPVADLRQHDTALRAALDDCLRKPKPKRVHLLRTTTRRIEAQLALLALLTPALSEQADCFRKAAKAIRRAAGKLRDLDVHANQLDVLPKTPDTKTLAHHLDRQRDRRADKLRRILHKHQSKLLSALDDLEIALLPAGDLSLTPTHASRLAHHLYAGAASKLDPADPAQLHELRKAAKLARYIAESAPGRASTPTARHFNRIQQTVGDWHDWLTLADLAHQHLDPTSRLLTTLNQRRDRVYRASLQLIRTAHLAL